MAKFIDRGVAKADDPIYTEGIGIISIRRQPKPQLGTVVNNDPATTPKPTNKETPHEPSN